MRIFRPVEVAVGAGAAAAVAVGAAAAPVCSGALTDVAPFRPGPAATAVLTGSGAAVAVAVALGVGAGAAVALVRMRGDKAARMETGIVLGLVTVAFLATAKTALEGGKIRHEEVRPGFVFPAGEHND